MYLTEKENSSIPKSFSVVSSHVSSKCYLAARTPVSFTLLTDKTASRTVNSESRTNSGGKGTQGVYLVHPCSKEVQEQVPLGCIHLSPEYLQDGDLGLCVFKRHHTYHGQTLTRNTLMFRHTVLAEGDAPSIKEVRTGHRNKQEEENQMQTQLVGVCFREDQIWKQTLKELRPPHGENTTQDPSY